MKKGLKTMESSSIRVYEKIMRTRLLNNLGAAFLMAFTMGAVSDAYQSGTPYFIIINEGAHFGEIVNRIKAVGGHVRLRVPPRIFIADIPEGFDLSSIPAIENHHLGVIPLVELEAYGPLAVAAGIQWNQSMVTSVKKMGPKAFMSMKQHVGSHSLPVPKNLDVRVQNENIHLEWSPQSGAVLYEIQMSLDANFEKIVTQTISEKPQILIPAPAKSAIKKLYLRVRAGDEHDGLLWGLWSKALAFSPDIPDKSLTQPAPVLTSPVDGMESQGFNVILEWSSPQAGPHQVQISKSDNFKFPLINAISPTQEFVIPAPGLILGKTYFWRTRLWGDVSSPWSEIRHFIVGEPRHPDVDALINPETPK
jgi:hypothetical protein